MDARRKEWVDEGLGLRVKIRRATDDFPRLPTSCISDNPPSIPTVSVRRVAIITGSVNQAFVVAARSQVTDEPPVSQEFFQTRGQFQGVQVSLSRWGDVRWDRLWRFPKRSEVCTQGLEYGIANPICHTLRGRVSHGLVRLRSRAPSIQFFVDDNPNRSDPSMQRNEPRPSGFV